MACLDCHRRDQLPSAERVETVMALSVWSGARTRELPFAHERHATVECTECHRAPVTMARTRECGSCHEGHHRVESTCASCHEGVARMPHRSASHVTCAGSQCHAAPVAPPATLSRNLCVTCHTAQADHEPGGSCASCHMIPPTTAPRAATGGRTAGARHAVPGARGRGQGHPAGGM
jgi:hypothetical protein